METSQSEQICKSCGNNFIGLYCNQCGEKIILPQDRSFRAFLSGIFLALTFVDGKFIRSLWLILSKPGFLTLEFAEGRRVKYLRPLSLFFLLNLIYFLFPIIQLFNASLRTQLNSFHGKYAVEIVASKMEEAEISDIGSFSLLYDEKTSGLAKVLVIAFAILVSLPLNILYRSRNRYFTDHVGLAVELVCFNLFVNAIMLSVVISILQLGYFLNEFGLTTILLTTNLYFILRAGNTFYQDRAIKLIARSLMMILILKVSLELYRALLFYVTIWSM